MTTLESLVQAAIQVSRNAYVPYSHYHVGAALESQDGQIFKGCNVENAAYPATICAERSALVSAVSAGQQGFKRIAIVTANGGSPCGICRQMLYEFSPNLEVILADMSGQIHYQGVLSDLLPLGFGPDQLPGNS
ncbi:cytidine deaminase [Anaerolineales bacterium]